jgi:glutamate/tyrosine decarboxylase-like PLP-dependent enzyme
MSHRASYLIHADDARDQMDWNLEWSRRGRGIATYAAIRELGTSGIADLVDRCCRYASELVERIGSLDGAEVVSPAQINQGLVRFIDPSGTSHDARTDEVIARIVAGGEAFFGGTTWNGMRCMRVSVSGWQTTDSDIDRTVEAVKAAINA